MPGSQADSPNRENADPAELDKFSRLAEDWWEPAGESRALHAMNPVRVAWLARQAGGLQGKRVADVGCGGGILSEALAAAGAEVVAIDLSTAALEAARRHLDESGVEVDYREASAEQLAAEEPAGFDVVACMEMLEHVPAPAGIVEACSAMLRPGGTVAFSTINRTRRAWLLAIAGAEYALRILPRGTHQYERFIRPSELAQWCRHAGLEITATRGMAYNPLTNECREIANTQVNYLMAARKPADP